MNEIDQVYGEHILGEGKFVVQRIHMLVFLAISEYVSQIHCKTNTPLNHEYPQNQATCRDY